MNDLKEPRIDSKLRFRMANKKSDLPYIVALAREAHEENRFGYIPFSERKVRKIASDALDYEKRYGVMLATKGDRPVGFASCSVG